MSQSGQNVSVRYKVEGTLNTAPGDTGAKVFPITGGGLGLTRTLIEDPSIRDDGQSGMARLGSGKVAGSYSGVLRCWAYDELLQAVLRSTWTAATAITVDAGAALTSFEVLSTSTFQFAGTTTPIAAGLRVGDVGRFTNMSNAANNNINTVVKSISGSVVTVHGTPLTIQAADTAATFTILKKLKHAATPTNRTFYFEEYNADIDLSEVFGGCAIDSVKITGGPDAMAMIEFGIVGLSSTSLITSASPYYTSPTAYTTIGLTLADATLRWGGSTVVDLTAFEVSLSLSGSTLPTIGSVLGPFENNAKVSGSISGVRGDLAAAAAVANETEFEFHALLIEPESEPKDCISIYIPRIKLANVSKSLGSSGPLIETRPFTVGKKEGAAATGFDETMLTICTSAAP
jgi:hypothetical protein